MLKYLPCFLLLLVCSFAVATDIYSDIDGDGVKERFTERRDGDYTVIDVYDGNVLIGKFPDVKQSFSSFDSRIVRSPSGGISVVMNTDASRYKYKTIVPIKKRNGELYFTCAYNIVYDAVDVENLAGINCGNGIEYRLTRENFEIVMTEVGLKKFSKKLPWIAKAKANITCSSPEGLEYGGYFILRCASLTKSSQQVTTYVFEKNKEKPIFSVEGFDFIPFSDGASFALATINDPLGAVVLKGFLKCFVSIGDQGESVHGAGLIDQKSAFKYKIKNSGGCLIGSYQYDRIKKDIALKGANIDEKYYLIEFDGLSPKANAYFMLDKLSDGKIDGEWLSVPPRKNSPIDTP